MAKAKTKAKKKAAQKSRKRTAPKEVSSGPKKAASEATQSKPKGPVVVVKNHRFAPGTEVGFWPAHQVEVERGLAREPFSKPTAKATVKARGLLEVRGLTSGQWCAAGPVGDTVGYLQFSV
jgi:hypothetical protein